MSDLVVVSAHGTDYIDRCLESLGDQYPVRVVFTEGGYQMTAVLSAYEESDADTFLFVQDSMTALQPDYLEPFRDKMPDSGCVAWTLFEEKFGGGREWQDKVRERGRPQYDLEYYPDGGIFGPVFYTNRASLDEIVEKGLLPPTPTNKEQDQLNERFWLWAFYQAGMTVRALCGGWDPVGMGRGLYPPFSKTFANRQ